MLGILISFLAVATATGETPIAHPQTKEIQLKEGVIQGTGESFSKSDSSFFFYSFRGIPYAAPPVGELRFKDPQPPLPWSGTRQSLTPPPCPQMSLEAFLRNGDFEVTGDEDCLYLHVYTPRPFEVAQLPVMVYIHGGAFTLGDADNLGGSPKPLLTKNIVLVSIQYRLGSLGFLSTGDSVLPGNLGLKDQTAALKWVQENILKFGGDPNRVTIFGESAGAASVHYQILTPQSKGLFHRAIMQSGNSLNLWAFRDDHAERALSMAKSFKCPGTEDSSADSNQLLECFMKKSPMELVLESLKDTVMSLPFYMVPRTDGDYLPANPAQMLREGIYNQVDIMTGLCQNEGASFISMYLMNDTVAKDILANFESNGPKLLSLDNQNDKMYLTRRAFYHYLGDIDISFKSADRFQKLISDALMNVAHDEVTIQHARDAAYGKKTFRYELQHRGQSSYQDLYNVSTGHNDEWVAHADDLIFLFDSLYGITPISRADDLFLQEIMIDLWTNFAITGNPTPNMNLGFRWDAMNSTEDMRYLSLTPVPVMKDDNRADVRKFWRDLPLKQNKLLFPEMFF
ncbi:juvenile hormone esterase-like [Palaemon carinicauda]|uniref:juvenile hormone esterase-like n=1 Tax=Palaemon carinicauda TaxID=392227 RepID=UPI0035B66AA7